MSMKPILEKSQWVTHSEGGTETVVFWVMMASVYLPASAVKKKRFYRIRRKAAECWPHTGHCEGSCLPRAHHKGKDTHWAAQGKVGELNGKVPMAEDKSLLSRRVPQPTRFWTRRFGNLASPMVSVANQGHTVLLWPCIRSFTVLALPGFPNCSVRNSLADGHDMQITGYLTVVQHFGTFLSVS